MSLKKPLSPASQKLVDEFVATLDECPYCTSDNKAVRDTYYDQTCEGCVKRMGVSSDGSADRTQYTCPDGQKCKSTDDFTACDGGCRRLP